MAPAVSDATMVRAAGGVVWRPTEGGVEVVVVHRPRYDDWSLPKGKVDAGEHVLATAYREVIEETGIQPLLGPRLPSTSYLVAGPHGAQPKTVDYWAMRAVGGEFVRNDETDGLAWLSPAAAASRVTHEHDAEVLQAFTALPPITGTVVLVRHAKAGDAHRWEGDDRDRPLEPTGQAQAVWLAELLPLFGPTRLLSARKVRCEQTIEPLADRLGQSIVTDRSLDEETFAEDKDAVLERLRGLAADGGVTVASSQGGLIPWAVSELAEADAAAVDNDSTAHRRDGSLRSRKGSAWVLSFAGRRLVQADYVASLRTKSTK
jgi:8-oxo-dGTP pyrophosphatase MutT (NUDIX family)